MDSIDAAGHASAGSISDASAPMPAAHPDSRLPDADLVDPVASLPTIPLTAAQRGMWFAENLSSDYSVIVAHYLDIRDDPGTTLDVDRFARIVRETAWELQSAFTRIVETDGVPMQVVDPEVDFGLEIRDMRGQADPVAAAQAWMTADHQRAVDLRTEPLVVSSLLRVADDRVFWYLRGHHIVIDGFAALTSVEEALARYNAELAGTEYRSKPRADLAELVADDEAYARSKRRETDRAHWAERAADLPERVSLAETAVIAPLTPVNVVASARMDQCRQRSVDDTAARLGTSPAVLLTAAFAVYLARMTGADDAVLSLPVTGRATARIKRASGMVSNMLPIVARDVTAQSTADLVAQVQLEMTGALRHQRYRFEDIRVDAGMRESNTASFGPIVNMMFFDKPLQITGGTIDYHILSSGILEDLRINLYRAGPQERLIVDLHGNPGLYRQAELDRHLNRFLTLLDRLLADPDTAVGRVDILFDGEATALTAMGVGPQSDRGPDRHLLDGFAAQVRRTPEAVAVVDGDRRWTYAEFDALRDQLADRLCIDGIRAGDRVVVSLPRGADQVAAVYAILTAGAAYVPVDPGAPARRRALIADTVGAEVVIDADYLTRARAFVTNRAKSDAPVVASKAATDPRLPAYVIFTSGSTGTPKGVEVDHDAILNRLTWMQDDHPLDATDAVLYKTPITFDVSVWELFWPLRTGARMVIARPDGHRDPDYLAALIDSAGVTTMHFVPSMLDTFVDVRSHALDAVPGSPSTVFGAAVRRVFSSGEALSRGLADKVAASGDVELINLYGPTEAAVDVTAHRVVAGAGSVPIGRPVANTAVHVLDAHLRPVPSGVAGELYLSGAQLARGYVARPELTADRFVADPYGASGTRMYRTGDMVRWHDSGKGPAELEYLGRTDFQVKIRGQRVELGEIESVIGELPQVGAVTVVARTDSGAPDLVAYIRYDDAVADADVLTPQSVLAVCRRHLPSHMVPSAVMVLDEFPVGSTGKLDRAALPEPTPMAAAAFAAPVSETETVLAGLIGEMLDRDRVGVHDNLFSIGGDSLMAARLVSRARVDHGLTLRLADVFDSADIGELAGRAVPQTAGDLPVLTAGIAGDGPIPLSHAQTRLWFVNRMDPGAATYNMPGALRLGPDTDLDALRAAVRDVVDRHETLRTRYPAVEGEPVQEILSTDAVDEVFAAPVRRVDGSLADAIAAEAAHGFDLVEEVGFRWAVLADADGYVAVMVLHHIAADGFSLVPLMRDLLWAYQSRRSHRAPDWTPLPLRYADFACWQHAMLGGEDKPSPLQIAESEFWADELADLPELLDLPTDHPRPAVATGRGDYVDLTVESGLVGAIHELARATAVTPFTVVHAALAAVLARLADTDDIAIGTAVAGRDDPQTADLVGMFVNTVVLRTRVPVDATASELLAAAHRSRSRALAHAHLPFERVVDVVSPQRSPSYTPLFQVALTTLKADPAVERGQYAIGEGSPIDARVPAAKYDLSFTLTEHPHLSDTDAQIEISYARDLFERVTVARIGEELLTTLRAMVTRPDDHLARIDLLPSDRVAALTRRALSPVMPETFRDLFAAGAARADHTAPALVGVDATMTWAVFDARTNQLARELIDRGIGPGDLVAISIPRSVHSVFATVAVAKTGAAFVSIDPRHPEARRADMLADVNPVLGLTVLEVADQMVAGTGESNWLVMDDETIELRLAGHSGARILDRELTTTPRLGDLAYLIFTSGSTGRPKAAAVSHHGLANMVANQIRLLALDPDSRVLHVASPSFDASVFEITMGLCAGGRLVISPADVYADADLERVIDDSGATHAVMTPSALSTLDPGAVTSLRTVVSVGEACPPELMQRFVGAGRDFFNLYGPTEATIWSTSAGPMRTDAPMTVGPAVPGVGALVLDRALRPVPDGVPGELYLTGVQLARGYHGRTELTSERFVANPFGSGTRMYRTGDRVCRTTDGALIYLGRKDFQLKIRGQRIEPGELDAVLMEHPEVTNALSVGVPGPAGQTVLVSYVTVADGAGPSPESIIDHAADHLPVHLVPHTVRVVDGFRLTPVGKIDRKALPPIDFSLTTEFVAPRTEMEGVVANVFAEVLHVSAVSVHDGFFTLGGNSLSATKVASRLSALLDRQVSVKDLFERPTVAAFATHLTTSVGGRSAPALTARSRAAMVPVSGLQRGMWLLNRADPESANYNVALALRMTGQLDTGALRAAITDLVTRHESLRTTYPMVNGTPVQVIVPVADLIDELDLHVTVVDGDLEAAIGRVTGLGFDVVAHPPLRVAVLQVGPADHVLVFVVHHISADGASMAPLARDLMTAYAARHIGAAPAWTPLPVQYADFTLWQAEKLSATDATDTPVTEEARQLSYWRDRLAGVPDQIELPTDRPRPRTPTFAGATVDFAIPVDLTRGLEAVARTSNTTLFMVTHAAFAVLCSRITGRGDVVIGTPYAGRGDAALDDVVGMFVNTLPLRTRVDVADDFGALLDRVRADDLMDMAHADVAFDSIVSEVLTSTPTSYNPLFQVMFAFQNIDFPTLELAGLTIAPEDEQLVSAKVDLQLTLFPQDPSGATDDGVIKGQLLYATDLLDARSVDRFAQWYLRVLEAIVADPSCVVGDIALQTITAVGDLDPAHDAGAAETISLPELTAQAANADAQATAVQRDDFTMTFGELDSMTSAMSAALPGDDPDSALTMAVMSSVPDLAAAGPEALDAILGELRTRATALVAADAPDRASVRESERP